MEKEGDPSGGWRFAQCFGDKGEVEEITEGKLSALTTAITLGSRKSQGQHRTPTAVWIGSQCVQCRLQIRCIATL